MALGVSGQFLPSTIATGDPINVTVNRTVDLGDVAIVTISHSNPSVSITGVTDSAGNDYQVRSISNSDGAAGIAVAYVSNTLTSGVSTVSVNLSSSARCIIRGATYSGIVSDWITSATKATEGSNYNISWTNTKDGVAFVCFGFPVDYSFSDTSITGWSSVFVTDDLTGLHSQQVFRNDVSSGTVEAQNSSPSVLYLAVGIVLPYTTPGVYGQAVVVL